MLFEAAKKRGGKFVRIVTVLMVCVLVFPLSSCIFFDDFTYQWYDADMKLIYEETIGFFDEPTIPDLPADTEVWDYTEWVFSDDESYLIAHRVPQASYFAGNVFQIVSKDMGEMPLNAGSAFVFNEDGWFITNAHVIEGAYYAEAIFNIPNEETHESFTRLNINSGTYYNADKDLYIGKIENYSSISSHYREIAINSEYELGETTYSIGYPNASAAMLVNDGVVTETWSNIYDKLYSGNSYICSSSYIAPGSSGGILVNADLEVIGITTLGLMDENDEYIGGASISAFNFVNHLKHTSDTSLVNLLNRFHGDSLYYVRYFNKAKEDQGAGLAQKLYLEEEGITAYVYSLKNEVNEGSDVRTIKETKTARSDYFMSYEHETYWGIGDRRTISFSGVYDPKDRFDGFTFTFKYEFKNGGYYTLTSSNVNYSSTLSLTLNDYELECSDGVTPSDEDILEVKRWFNDIYEQLTEDVYVNSLT